MRGQMFFNIIFNFAADLNVDFEFTDNSLWESQENVRRWSKDIKSFLSADRGKFQADTILQYSF